MIRAIVSAMLLLGSGAAAQDAAPLSAGQGRVIFYRTGGFYYSGRSCPLFEEKSGESMKIAALRGGKYVTMQLDPGTHRFATSGRKHPVEVEVEAGRTSYVRCQLSGFPGSPRLFASHATEFERFSRDLEAAE